MQKHIYDLRFEVDKTEWRIRAKRDLVYRYWDKLNSSKEPQKMLDFGCGTGVLQEEMSRYYPYITSYGIDVSAEAIDYCKKRGLERSKIYDGKTIPFSHNSFDLVTAIDVVEHIRDDMFALKEIKRVLKPGGKVIFIVPAHMELWSTRDIRLQHFRRYEKGELEAKCEETGLEVHHSKNVDFLLYFALLAMCKVAKKRKGIPDLGMETASTNIVLNELLYQYEMAENTWNDIATFPIGISILVTATKPE